MRNTQYFFLNFVDKEIKKIIIIGGCVKEDYANYGIYGATGQGDLSDSPPDGSEDPAYAAQNR